METVVSPEGEITHKAKGVSKKKTFAGMSEHPLAKKKFSEVVVGKGEKSKIVNHMTNVLKGELDCTLAKGKNCNTPEGYRKSFNELVEKAAANDKASITKMQRILKGMKKLKGPLKWTGYGLLAEAGFMVPFAVHDYATGKSWKRILGNATDWGFGPMLGQSEQEEFLAGLPEGSKAVEAQELERLGTQLSALEEDKPRPTSRIGMDPRRFEKSQVDMQNKLIDEFNLNLDPFLSDTPYAQGQWHQGMWNQAQQDIIDRKAAIAQKEFERIQKRRKQGIIAEDDWMVGGDTRGYRDGGIVSLLKK